MSIRRILVIGTGNKHKAEEIAPLLNSAGLHLDLKAASEYGPFDPVEDGETLEEKRGYQSARGGRAFERMGDCRRHGPFRRCVEWPAGIYAARYAGLGCSFVDNIRKLLRELEGIPVAERGATFSCVIALCRPECEPVTFRGECRGQILLRPKGDGGFGYDPVFEIDGVQKSFAQLTPEEKNTVSHRAIAVKKCRAALSALLIRK